MRSFKELAHNLNVFMAFPIVIACRKTWNEYCDIAYMHGVKYICDRSVNTYIRIIWAVIVIIMFTLATQLVYSIYLDFIDDPTRFYIESDNANTAQLLYPAVTVCPATLYNRSKAEEFVKTLNLPENLAPEKVIDSLSEANGFISWKFKYNKGKLATLQTVFALNNITAQVFFDKTKWDCGDIFFRCRFQAQIINCSDLFYISKTFSGLCCSFNAPQITLEKMTSKSFKSNRYTLIQGLSFILKDTRAATDQISVKPPWFQILIHESNVYPNEYSFQKFIRNNQEILFRTKPTETVCAPEVWRRLDVDERKCALPSETKLRFFSEYRRQNCLTECRTLTTQKLCGCVPYYLFRDEKIPVCDFEHVPCLSDNYDRLLAMRDICNCVDSCEKVEYSIRLTSTSTENMADTVDHFYDDLHSNNTVIHVYMQSQIYRRVRRDIIWNIVSLIGNLGNSFSIFIGLSALSVVQFFYFFTFVLKKNYRKKSHVGDKKLFKKTEVNSSRN